MCLLILTHFRPPTTVEKTVSYSFTKLVTSVFTTILPSLSVKTVTKSPMICQAGTTYVTNFNYGNHTTTIDCKASSTSSTSRSSNCPSFCPPVSVCSGGTVTTTETVPILFPPVTIFSSKLSSLLKHRANTEISYCIDLDIPMCDQ